MVGSAAGGVALEFQLRHSTHHIDSRGLPRPLCSPSAQPVRPATAPGKPGSHLLRFYRGLGPLHRADDVGNGLRRGSTRAAGYPAVGGAGAQLPVPVLSGYAHPGDDGGPGHSVFHGPRLHGRAAGAAGSAARHL